MSVPVRRQTHGKTRLRRAHHGLKKMVLSICAKCKKTVKPHHACGFCGTYSGKQVVDQSRQSERSLRRAQAASTAKREAKETKADEKETKKETKKEA